MYNKKISLRKCLESSAAFCARSLEGVVKSAAAAHAATAAHHAAATAAHVTASGSTAHTPTEIFLALA